MTAFDELLVSLGACEDAREWAKGKSFADVWNTCERSDWLLWLLAKMKDKPGWATHKQIVSAACDCAELSLKYVEVGEERPRVAIETARKWVRGEATLEEVKKAARKADRAAYAAADYAVAYAASAAYISVAYAASAASAAASAASRISILKECADLIRKSIEMPRWDKE
jgi:hypothetical protein